MALCQPVFFMQIMSQAAATYVCEGRFYMMSDTELLYKGGRIEDTLVALVYGQKSITVINKEEKKKWQFSREQVLHL